jgi:hypothetical protein
VFFGQPPHLRGIDVAGYDQDGIVRRVPTAIEGQGRFRIERRDFVVPADHRNAVGMIEVERGVDQLEELRPRIVVDPTAPLLANHLALRQHDLVGQLETRHAVGLMLHDDLEPVAGDALEIAGVVPRGERVLATAVLGDDTRELSWAKRLGTLEHQMFKEVRQARLAGRLIGGTDFVPHHVRDDGRPAVGDHHHLEPVIEREDLRIEDLSGDRAAGCKEQKKYEE